MKAIGVFVCRLLQVVGRRGSVVVAGQTCRLLLSAGAKESKKKQNAGWQGLNLDFRNAVPLVHNVFGLNLSLFRHKKTYGLAKVTFKLLCCLLVSPPSTGVTPLFLKTLPLSHFHFLKVAAAKVRLNKSFFVLEEERERETAKRRVENEESFPYVGTAPKAA